MGKHIHIASILSFFIVAVSIVAMFFEGSAITTEISSFSMICGICFWVFLIIGVVLQILLSRRIGKWRATYCRTEKISHRIGLISVFKSPLGIVSDILFLSSVIAFGIAYYFTGGIGIICYVFLSLIFFSFCTHCIFNGKNYYYIVNQHIIEDRHRKMMEESQ